MTLTGNTSASARASSKQQLWLLAIILIGAFLRLDGLASESIWLDEATSILLAKLPIPDLVRTTAEDIHPPLYYALLHVWETLGTGEFEVRSLSAFTGIVSVALMYQMGRRLFDEQGGQISALLLAMSPLHIWYSQETRMYALVTLFTLAGSYWLWRALRTGSRATWVAYACCMALGLYTHYHCIFVLFSQNVFVGVWWLLSRKPADMLRKWLLAEAGIGLLFLPWIPTVFSQITGGGGNWVAQAIGHPGPRALLGTLIDYSIGTAWVWYPVWLRRIGYIVFTAMIGSAGIDALRQWRRDAVGTESASYFFCILYLCLSLGAVWTVSQVMPMYARRYLLPFLPAYLLLLAAGIRAIPWPRWQVGLAGALALLSLAGTLLASSHPQKDDWRGVVQYVMAHREPQDVVVFDPMWNYKPFDYYAQGTISLDSSIPVPLPADADLDIILQPALSSHARLWLVWIPGHYADPGGRVQAFLDNRYPQLARAEFAGAGITSLYDLRADAP